MARERLRVAAGPAGVKEFPIGEELILGTEVTGEGRLGDDHVDPAHARILRTAGGRLLVEDLRSSVGTYVNGHLVRGPVVLKVGDTIEVGAAVMQIVREGESIAPPGDEDPPARR